MFDGRGSQDAANKFIVSKTNHAENVRVKERNLRNEKKTRANISNHHQMHFMERICLNVQTFGH